MNREINFRFWDKLTKKIIYPEEVWFKPKSIDLCSKWAVVHRVEGLAFSITDSCNAELMQYTGLKDKNGKEIYEGDIFKYYPYQSLPEIGKVLFKDACFIYNIHGDEYMLSELNNQIEVIGNIHENKDLLN